MRAVVSTEGQEGAKDEQGESDTIQRRPSIVVLQNMLKKIPQSPFVNTQQSVIPSPSSGSPASASRSNRDVFLNVTTDSQLSQDAAQRPNPQPVASTNPFYSYQLESRHKYDTSEDVGRKPWQEARAASDFVPLPEFHRSPLDWQENGASGSEGHKDSGHSLSSNHLPDDIFTSQIGQYQNTSRSSAESHPENLFKNLLSKSSSQRDLLQDSPEDFSLKAPSGKVSEKSDGLFADPFRPSSNTAEDLFGSPGDPAGNPFYSSSSTASHSFQANGGKFSHDDKLAYSGLSGSDLDVFSPSSNFSSSIVKELFGDGGSASDLFNPEAPNSGDVFGSLPRSGFTKSTSDLSEQTVRSTYSDAPRDVVLTTPQGSKHGILQPTPFSQAQKLSASSDSSPTESNHVTLTRRPPKPLPRSRPPRLEKPPVPDKSRKPAYIVEPETSGPPKPPPKPVKTRPVSFAGAAAKPQDGKALDKEHCDIFEDILLIGQEKCVEDWPEDSPQFHPDFKPSGKFRLRRESLTVTQISEEGATGENRDDFGVHAKKKDRKFLLLSRGASKDKLSDDMKDGRSWTLPSQGKSSKENFYDMNYPTGKREDGEQSWSDGKKKPLKNKVNQLLRRASTSLVQRQPAPASKDDDFLQKRMNMKESALRWHSQEAMFDSSKGEEEEAARAQLDEADAFAGKGKKKMKKKFAHLKGLTNSQEEQPQGAHGYTPRKDSKDREEQFFAGADMWQEHGLENVDELKGLHSSSQEDVPFFHPQQNSFPAEQLDYEAPNAADAYAAKKNKFKAPVPLPRKPKPSLGSPAPVEALIFGDATFAPTSGADNWSDEDDDALSERQHGDPVVDYYYKQDELVLQKPKKLKRKPFRKHKSKNKVWEGAVEEVPINHLSEAAQAEWLAAQRDERVVAGLEYGEGDGDGDTDSLMEWWYTVEKWDEVPSDEETKQRDDSESFTVLADKVNRGLQVFNKVFMERAEVFWQHVVKLHALADHLSTFHQKAKAAGITGSTTAAVGGVTAIAGLALAPFTFGASLIVTAVGVGVATAGGITSASASISDNVNIMQERKKVEAVLQEYEFDFRGLAEILHFVNHGLYKLRGHPFLRSGTQHYSEDWEVRKAVQMISLVDSPVMRAMEVTDAILQLVQGLNGGMEKYFKDSRNLKRAFKKQVVARIKEAANVLNDGVVELNSIREELQKAIGNF
ncbi:uncharacterized protein LOC109516535 isoform X2 [Hippocampus comes]|uniref:uncharacterized protein LOC109516535 isoform X2 n=1 Tax=Hippocampus comes TaxID=109280 RepID=UPI00094E7601|nr:PREDICTED: uncharacterized protein LOC109516535 isoform X2 [Hippocampus comes]